MEGIKITKELVQQIEEAKRELIKAKVNLTNYKIIFSGVPYIVDDMTNVREYKTICGLPIEINSLDGSMTYLIAPKTGMWL